MIYGGYYTYAETPLGNWVKEMLNCPGTIMIGSDSLALGSFQSSSSRRCFFG